MSYVFCNFLNENMFTGTERKGIQSVSVANDLEGAYTDCLISKGKRGLKFVPEGVREEGYDFIDIVGGFSENEAGLTADQMRSEEDNVLILTATKRVAFCEGIPTYIKYIPVDGGVFLMLIKGYIEVDVGRPEMVALSRCIESVPSRMKKHIVNDVDFKNMNLIVDRDSDVSYAGLCVSDCIVNFVKNKKDGSVSRKVKFVKENFVVFDTKPFKEGKALKEKKAKEKEEREKAKREENILFAKRMAEKQKAEEEEKKAEKEAKKAKKPSEKKKEKVSVSVGSEGASAFLAFVESLKN